MISATFVCHSTCCGKYKWRKCPMLYLHYPWWILPLLFCFVLLVNLLWGHLSVGIRVWVTYPNIKKADVCLSHNTLAWTSSHARSILFVCSSIESLRWQAVGRVRFARPRIPSPITLPPNLVAHCAVGSRNPHACTPLRGLQLKEVGAAHTNRWTFVDWPIVTQFNGVPKFAFIQGESHVFHGKDIEPI